MTTAPARRGRVEDLRFLTGAGLYASDLRADGLLHARFVRSTVANARIRAIDAEAARTIPGVVAIFTAADLAADRMPDIPTELDLRRADGSPAPSAKRPILAGAQVRFNGDPVALVVAETQAAATAAADAVVVDYDELPCVMTIDDAIAPGAPVVWPDAPDNRGFHWSGGDAAAVAAAMRGAAHVARRTLRISRVVANPLEARAALGRVDDDGRLVLHIGHQQPFALRDALARGIFKIAPERLRVLVPDIGGSFGLRTGVHSEEVAVLWAARRLKQPVRWLADRSEAFLADDHSREMTVDAALAFDRDGRFLALHVNGDLNVGCYLSKRSAAALNNIGGVAGVYRIPVIHAQLCGVLTHTAPTGPYRGAGRPEATFVIEQIIDAAARELGKDAFELRRLNLIGADEMPFKTALTFTYDSGNFARVMQRAAELSDLAGFAGRRNESLSRGKWRGLGVVNLIEAAGGPYGRPSPDAAIVRMRADGSVLVTTGAISTGQGIETTAAGIVAERLGIATSQIAIESGDTDALPRGRGSGGSGSVCVSGATLAQATVDLLEKILARAAGRFEAATHDIELRDGRARIKGTDVSCTLAELASNSERDADGENTLIGRAEFQPAAVTYPNGCHVCEVEIDPDTGGTVVVRYVAVEDVGRVLNSVLVEGQIHGGVALGIGQALGEQIRYDSDGQLVTGSFMDYAMPRADDLPPIIADTIEIATNVNALGAKGVGEAGTVGALAATMSAVQDALAQCGDTHLDMPATPARVWTAIHAAVKKPPRDA